MELKGQGGLLWVNGTLIGDVISFEVCTREEAVKPSRVYRPDRFSAWRPYLSAMRADIEARRRLGEANGVAH